MDRLIGSLEELAVSFRLGSAASGSRAVAFAVAMSAAGGASWADEAREQPPDAALETEAGQSAELPANPQQLEAHKALRTKAWDHIRDGEYDAAIAVLLELQADEFPEDAAFTHRALAAAYNFKRDYERVLHHQVQIVEQPGNLPPASVRRALMSAGYLSFQQGRFEDAVRYMENWQADEDNPPARFYAMLAWAYAEVGDRGKSMENAEMAARIAETEGTAMPEWLEKLRSDGHRDPAKAGGDLSEDGQR